MPLKKKARALLILLSIRWFIVILKHTEKQSFRKVYIHTSGIADGIMWQELMRGHKIVLQREYRLPTPPMPYLLSLAQELHLSAYLEIAPTKKGNGLYTKNRVFLCGPE